MINDLQQPHQSRRGRPPQAMTDAAAQAADCRRLDVVATAVPDVVRAAGGWLTDRAWEGWRVNVYVADGQDTRALDILGAKPRVLSEALSLDSDELGTLAITADLVESYRESCPDLFSQLHFWVTEFIIFGAASDSRNFGSPFHAVTRAPSLVAQAFKRHALTAIGDDSVLADTAETYISSLDATAAVRELVPHRHAAAASGRSLSIRDQNTVTA